MGARYSVRPTGADATGAGGALDRIERAVTGIECDPATLGRAVDRLSVTITRFRTTANRSDHALRASELIADIDSGPSARSFIEEIAAADADIGRLARNCGIVKAAASRADRLVRTPPKAHRAAVGFGWRPLLGALDRPTDTVGCRPATGDIGGTGTAEPRVRWEAGEGTPPTLGREVLMRALADTADECQLGPDEIGLVDVGGRWILVLPGVTDLSAIAEWATRYPSVGRPEGSPWGLSPAHRSVRDTDAVARRSATSAGIADNRYAALVASIVAQRVPAGAEIAIIGHSAGADAALDLAADPEFNGSGRYSVTHVAAFAYYSEPMLPSVPAGTKVLAVENSRDLVVRGEHALSTPNRLLEAALTAARGDLAGGYRRVVDAHRRGIDQLADGAALIASNVLDDLSTGHLPSLDSLTSSATRSTRPTPDQTHVVFKGDAADAGHHQRHYIDYLRSATGDAGADIDDFATDLAAAGYAAGGGFSAIDVSVPTLLTSIADAFERRRESIPPGASHTRRPRTRNRGRSANTGRRSTPRIGELGELGHRLK